MKTEINWGYFGTISSDVANLADECCGWCDTIEEAQREFNRKRGNATGGDSVYFYYEY